MIIYFALVLLILILNYLRINSRISTSKCINILCLVFIIITGLRNPSVGADSYVYLDMFESATHVSLSEYSISHRDIGFSLLVWVVMNIGGNFTVISLLVASAFYIPFFKLLKRYSTDPGLSVLILMAFTFFQFTMTGMRQTAALGFTFLFLDELFTGNRKWFKTLLWFVLAYLFHKSSVVILFYPLIQYLTNKGTGYKIFYLLIPIMFLLRSQIVGICLPLLQSEGFDFNMDERGGGITTFLVFAVLFLYGAIVKKNRFSIISSFDIGLMAVIVSLQSLVYENSLLFRGVWYFSFYICIFIPKLIQSSYWQERRLIGICVYVAILFMYFGLTMGSAHVLPYKFFWQ